MINLVPPTKRQEIEYAKRNVRIVRWISGLSVGLCTMGLVVLAGRIIMQVSVDSYGSKIIRSEEKLKVEKLDETQKRVNEISGSLKLTVQVLGREVLFSKLLKQIGAVMPSGAALSGISISKTAGAIELNAIATDYQTASQVQVNLADPQNKIFDKADIVSIACDSASSANPGYPCTATYKAQFGKDNPFLLINKSATTGTAR